MSKSVMMQPLFFVIKRLLLALTCVFLRGQIYLQVQVFSSITVFSMIYLAKVLPNDSNMINGLDVMNEILSLFILYHLLIFTDWVPHAKIRYDFGYSLIVFLTIGIGTHIALMIWTQAKEIKSYIKECLLKRKQEQKRLKDKRSNE